MATLALAIALAACKPTAPAEPQPVAVEPAVMTAILDAQTARTRAITDFAITGTVQQKSGPEQVAFTLAFAQPGALRSTLDDGRTKVELRFDGKQMMAVDRTHNTAEVKDLSVLSDDDRLLVVMQAFGRLFCEGWRPPLLSPQRTHPAAMAGKDVLVVALDDETVKEERYFFLPGTHDFDGRSTVDKLGNEIAFLHVLERKTDAKTGLTFPVKWEKKDAQGDVVITLSDTQVNQGVDASMFSTTPPADVTVVK